MRIASKDVADKCGRGNSGVEWVGWWVSGACEGLGDCDEGRKNYAKEE